MSLSARQIAHFGKRLRALRTSKGLTQRALAQKTNVSVGLISLIEGNEQEPEAATRRPSNPSLGVLLALVSGLELHSIEELLGDLPTRHFHEIGTDGVV